MQGSHVNKGRTAVPPAGHLGERKRKRQQPGDARHLKRGIVKGMAWSGRKIVVAARGRSRGGTRAPSLWGNGSPENAGAYGWS
jgi:hypothetical protein